jgi:hypothetical protein
MIANPQVTAIREAIEYAPATGPVAPGLRGLWLRENYYLCAPCVGRIIARGCGHLLREGQQVWADQPEPYGVCVTCEPETETETE